MTPTQPASASCIAAVAFIFLTAGIANPAGGDTVFDGSKARVNLSSKLNMLSQTIGSAACRIKAGIGSDAAREELQAARTDFNTILDGLEHGGPALGIPTEERYSVVRRSIGKVRAVWSEMDAASETLVSGIGDTSAAAGQIGEANLALLDATGILASDISGKYSNPHELTQSDAMSLHFAGRQRMLGFRMAKEVCGIATGQGAFGAADDLQGTVGLFDVSLRALREGMPNAGINPPPTDVIQSELDTIGGRWTANVQALRAVAGNATPDQSTVVTVAELSSDLTRDMSNVVTLYMLATPGQDDVYQVPLRAYAQNELSKWLDDPALLAAVKGQNSAHANLTQEDIDTLDETWRAEAKADGGPLITEILNREVSEWMRDKQSETADFVTEVFAMDNRGLNVAQNVETSDFWQGDEAKWQETFGNQSGDIHISDVEYDESTGVYQSQVSMPIADPATGELIGAITFGINIQSLL